MNHEPAPDPTDTFGLLEIANEAYKFLSVFLKIYDKIKQGFFAGKEQIIPETEQALIDINTCTQQLSYYLNLLESKIPLLVERPTKIADVEMEYCWALQSYLCDLLNMMNSYRHVLQTRIASYKKFSYTRAWKSWWDYRRCERHRMRSGKDLMHAYSQYNIGLHAVEFTSRP